jgi:hypothetical protein
VSEQPPGTRCMPHRVDTAPHTGMERGGTHIVHLPPRMGQFEFATYGGPPLLEQRTHAVRCHSGAHCSSSGYKYSIQHAERVLDHSSLVRCEHKQRVVPHPLGFHCFDPVQRKQRRANSAAEGQTEPLRRAG